MHEVAREEQCGLLHERSCDGLDGFGHVDIFEGFEEDRGILVAQLSEQIDLKDIQLYSLLIARSTLCLIVAADDEYACIAG